LYNEHYHFNTRRKKMIKRRSLESWYLITIFLLANAGLVQAGTITIGPVASYDFDIIQAGIDAASAGDTVLVAPGEYVITVPITFRGKAITVRSEAGPDETTIRMGTPADTNRGSVVIFENNETTSSVLDGFAITEGRSCWFDEYGASAGGGIVFNASSGTIRDCAIVQNRAEYGGGIGCAHQCSTVLIDCTIAENLCEEDGGGVFTFDGCSMILTNCIIKGNSNTGVDNNGGGVSCGQNSFVTMTDCIVSGNSSTNGGAGVACWYGTLNLTRCAIVGNMAGDWFGGGVYAGHSSATLTNCVIARNTAPRGGGGVCSSYADAFMTISNCTIWGNSGGSECGGGGVLCRNASAMVTNSIIWGNTSAKGCEISVEDPASTLTIAYSNVDGGQAGITVEGGCTLDWSVGNIDADPCFADPANDYYHLKSEAGRWDPIAQHWIQDDVTSPCIDAGDPMSPIGLEPFPNGGFVNMGAYGSTPEASKTYFGEPICETIVAGDINGDCQVNRADLEIMALHWTDEEPLPLP
jgi:hypothetical protein